MQLVAYSGLGLVIVEQYLVPTIANSLLPMAQVRPIRFAQGMALAAALARAAYVGRMRMHDNQ